MSSVPDQDEPGSGGAPVPWWNAASPVGGDVVLSAAVLLFLALAFAFVLYHYFTVRRRGERDGGVGAGAVAVASSSAQRRRRGDTVGGGHGAAAAGAAGGVSPAALRALPLTVYSAKDHAGEALECAVCLAELADGEAARFLPRCGHGFHAECVDLWLRGHSTCPLCRVEVDKTDAALPLALPPALPEPANYPRNLPTNVLFWGSQDAVTTTARTAIAFGGASSSAGAPAALVIEVRDREAAPPREGGAAKPTGLARLSSVRRLWNRGGHQDTAATSSRSCRRATAGGYRTGQALPSPLDIWNVT
jgi:E3 ubiquitin-protein ligase EL5